jgi:hypothetical protein
MAMLDRYKKTGGFVQLLALLESCGAQKQLKFLEIIRIEDPRWADALEAKMISLERFLTWSDSAIAEVTGAMLEINIAAILTSVPEHRERLLATLHHTKKSRVKDLVTSTNPTPAEIATSVSKLYETIRRLTNENVLRLDKVDPDKFIDEDIEDRLKQGKVICGVVSATDSLAKAVRTIPDDAGPETALLHIVKTMNPTSASPTSAGRDVAVHDQENLLLKKRLQLMQEENDALRLELAKFKARLDQIRKLA